MKYILVKLLLFCGVVYGKDMPKYIKTCRKADPDLNQCFMENGNLAIKYIAHGDPAYGFRSLYPLQFQDLITINAPTNPPLTLSLKNVTVYGLDDFVIDKASVDLKAGNIKFTLLNPLIIWKEYYIASIDNNGDVEETQGPGKISFADGVFDMNWDFDYYYINGIKYANIKNHSIKFVNYTIKFDLENIGSNENISNAMKEARKFFMNDTLKKLCSDVVTSYINGIFKNVPFDSIFT